MFVFAFRRGRCPHLPREAKLSKFSVEHYVQTKTPGLQVLTGTAGLNPATSFAMASLIFRSAKSEATRKAFLMAFAFDDPWVIKQTPFTPSSGAPPYSVWSRRFLKSWNALRESRYPTWRVMVAFNVSLRVARTRLATPSEVFSATFPTKPSA